MADILEARPLCVVDITLDDDAPIALGPAPPSDQSPPPASTSPRSRSPSMVPPLM